MQQAKEGIKEQISICGSVVHGRKMGRELGFPTANVNADAGLIENGVYGVCVSLKGNQYRGIMNIGLKPTFESNLEKTIEVHLLDFQNDIYGEEIECQLLFKVREERKFPSIEFLKHQIKEDIHYANQQFKLIRGFH
ncbi:riboflavin kinase [Peribacillus sp. V2I11]|uniref:riboflavin kinase n=1 Tax=Peribacillus sp. V2I11 TaxID=3042277 RepID=UPI00277F68A0|nr:riboflavin kinase [Peribacillus sp. V2I11]MDQ0884744.1 riboflavin kinase/FMN adenylyltransferase [Peribacillus sp. V2I11]